MLRDEAFSFKLLDKVPIPQKDECILLYRAGAGSGGSLLINNGVKYSAAEIRHGHYNRKAVLSIKPKTMTENKSIAIKSSNCYFNVDVKIDYILRDAQEYFFFEKIDKEDIGDEIRKIIKQYDGEWDIQQKLKAQSTLEETIIKKLRQYKSMQFRVLEVNVEPDEDAEKILRLNRATEVGIHAAEKKTEEEIAHNSQTVKALDSKREVTMKKMENMALMMKNFGSLGPIVGEYFDGNMDGKELYEHLMNAKTNDMSMLNAAVSNDLLTQDEAFETLKEILKDTKFFPIEKRQQLSVEDDSKIEENDKISPMDGDYI